MITVNPRVKRNRKLIYEFLTITDLNKIERQLALTLVYDSFEGLNFKQCNRIRTPRFFGTKRAEAASRSALLVSGRPTLPWADCCVAGEGCSTAGTGIGGDDGNLPSAAHVPNLRTCLG